MFDKTRLFWRAKTAALTSLILFGGLLVSLLIRSRGNPARPFDWERAAVASGALAALGFLLLFCWGAISDIRMRPVLEILEDEIPNPNLAEIALSGFVAMEFFWLILNRTYVVFIAPDGLYGWRAEGPVTNANRRYFEPYQQMIDDKELMRDVSAIQKLSRLRGGFYWRPTEVASVSADDRGQWGMGGVIHSGHVRVRLVSGNSKNFIILGEVIPEDVRDRIVSTLGVGITSGV